MGSRQRERSGMVPVFTANRSTSLASSYAPAASPWLRRRPSPWPPRRHAKPASESATHTRRPCTASRPVSTRFEPVPRLRSFTTLVPLVCRLASLAGPGPSGSTEPSRLCQRCLPPSPTSPGSGCAQLLPGCCDNPARRTPTSFGSRRLTAHRRLVAHTARKYSNRGVRTGPQATRTARTTSHPTPRHRAAGSSHRRGHLGVFQVGSGPGPS
jgi:hypothetical protein